MSVSVNTIIETCCQRKRNANKSTELQQFNSSQTYIAHKIRCDTSTVVYVLVVLKTIEF